MKNRMRKGMVLEAVRISKVHEEVVMNNEQTEANNLLSSVVKDILSLPAEKKTKQFETATQIYSGLVRKFIEIQDSLVEQVR